MTGALIGLFASTGAAAPRVGMVAHAASRPRSASAPVRARRPSVSPSVGSRRALSVPSSGRASAGPERRSATSSVGQRACRVVSYDLARRCRSKTSASVRSCGAAAGLASGSLSRCCCGRRVAQPCPCFCWCALIGLVAGVLWCDNHLSSQVRAREEQLQAEFPVVADLLGTGRCGGRESGRRPRTHHEGLQRAPVARAGPGAVGHPYGHADGQRHSTDSRARTGVASIARFAEGLAIAVERGTPLVDVLHAQAADVRESGRRELMEVGGRKEVAMMIPVVFLILPVTVVFAFFPGYIGLHLTSGM